MSFIIDFILALRKKKLRQKKSKKIVISDVLQWNLEAEFKYLYRGSIFVYSSQKLLYVT